MKTPTLILLLLLLLAPRLNASLPHALACMGAADTSDNSVSTQQDATAGHNTASTAHHGGHHEHEPHHNAAPVTAADVTADAEDGSDCQHCGMCEEHCSAVVLNTLVQHNTLQVHDLLISVTADQRAGFPLALNRPPRTSLS